jgi:hypothetical protein
MQTRKEVTEMHVAITRAVVVFVILAAVAAVFLVLGTAPVDSSTAMHAGCPPGC